MANFLIVADFLRTSAMIIAFCLTGALVTFYFLTFWALFRQVFTSKSSSSGSSKRR